MVLDLLDYFVTDSGDIVQVADDALVLALVGWCGIVGRGEESCGGGSKGPWDVVHACLSEESLDVVSEIELHSTVGITGDGSARVFGCLVMPHQLSVSFGECGFEELGDGGVSR